MTEHPISPLVAQLMTSSLTETHRISEHLIDTLTEQLADAYARERAVEEGVASLFDGDCMPTPRAVIRALLFPSPELIALYRSEREEGA